MTKKLKLVSDVLDSLLVDRQEKPLGRADGVVILADGDSQPRIEWIETGGPVLARRVGPRFARVFQSMARRFGIRRGRRLRIGWEKVQSVGTELKLNLDADQTPALAWERFLVQRIFTHIPGGRAKE